MSANKVQFRGWKLRVLVTLLIVGGIWGGLKWAEKAFARFYYEFEECGGQYKARYYTAFSLLDKALYFVPFPVFGGRDHPRFIRIIEKKTGRVIGETGVYWMMTAPTMFCPDKEYPKQIRIYFGGSNDEHEEIFEVTP